MSTIDELPQIVQALNRVTTAAQARVAIGAALNALHDSYDVVSVYLSGSVATFYSSELDAVRMPLEAWNKSIVANGNDDYTATFSAKKNLIFAAYNEVAAVEGASGYQSKTSNLQILLQSITEAPGVFQKGLEDALSAVAKTAGSVAAAAGDAAGMALGGVASGLGLGWVLIVIAGVCVFVFVKKGGLKGLALL